MSKADRTQKKIEAVARLKIFNVPPNIIRRFDEDDILFENHLGHCRQIDDKSLQRVKAFEQKYDALVYFVIRSYSYIGDTESYLYVSDDIEEWTNDQLYASHSEPIAYVYNHDDPFCSEFGLIGVQRSSAGLDRVF